MTNEQLLTAILQLTGASTERQTPEANDKRIASLMASDANNWSQSDKDLIRSEITRVLKSELGY